MTQNPPDWGQQGGYPPQGPGGYPPQQPSPGYPPQQPSPAIHRSSPADIRSSSHPSRAINHRAATARAGVRPPSWRISSSAGRFWAARAGPAAARHPGCASQEKPGDDHRDRGGGHCPAGRRWWDHHGVEPGRHRSARVSITPSQPAPPTEEPTPQPSGGPSSQPQPTPTESSQSPTGGAIDLGNGVELVPATGWEVKKTGKNVAQLSNGKSIFLGQSLQISPSTNPGQLCDAWHRDVAEGTSNGKFQDAKDADVGTTRLKAATCVAEVTVSGGQGTTKLYLFSLVSVRQSDGVTVIGTAYFTPNTETDQLNKDFTSMINTMLKSQASGG